MHERGDTKPGSPEGLGVIAALIALQHAERLSYDAHKMPQMREGKPAEKIAKDLIGEFIAQIERAFEFGDIRKVISTSPTTIGSLEKQSIQDRRALRGDITITSGPSIREGFTSIPSTAIGEAFSAHICARLNDDRGILSEDERRLSRVLTHPFTPRDDFPEDPIFDPVISEATFSLSGKSLWLHYPPALIDWQTVRPVILDTPRRIYARAPNAPRRHIGRPDIG